VFIADDATFSTEHFFVPSHYAPFVGAVLLPHGLIEDRVEALAAALRADDAAAAAASPPGGVTPGGSPATAGPVHLLVVLKGGAEFATDLARALRRQHAYDAAAPGGGARAIPFTVDYVRVKSYEGTQSTGAVAISGLNVGALAGRRVVVVEDIIDTGATMSRLVPALLGAGAASVRVAALLEKRTPKSCGFKGDYVGFSVPDAFVVGYGLDYNEAFRELPHVCVINGAGIEAFRDDPALAGLR